MPLALRLSSFPSQAETPARPAGQRVTQPGADAPPPTPAERARDERRGPMRPVRLSPTRSRLQGWTLGMIFRIADVLAMGVIALAAEQLFRGGLAPAGVTPFAIGGLALVWSLSTIHAYAFAQSEALGRHLVRVAAGFGLAALCLELLLSGFKPSAIRLYDFSLWCLASFLTLYLLHGVWWAIVRRWRRTGRLTPNIVVVGATANAEKLIAAALKSRDVAVLGVFDDRIDRIPDKIAGVPVLGDTQALLDHRIMPYVDRVVIAVPSLAQSRVRQLVEQLSVLPNEVMLFVEQDAVGRAATLSRIAEAPLAPVSGGVSDERRALVKRAEDLVIGTLAVVLGLPLMVAIAIAIKLDSPGPVFFRQRRHGFNNEEILVWKFRSMRAECSDPAATRQVSADDERVTRVGRFIRRTSLDELPQLLNVLKGEMSLVGPRPHAVGMKTGSTESAKLVAGYAHRHRLKPGMTGWAAIRGSRGPVETPEKVRRRVALDIEYIERQSLMLDLTIMALTIPCLLGDGEAVR